MWRNGERAWDPEAIGDSRGARPATRDQGETRTYLGMRDCPLPILWRTDRVVGTLRGIALGESPHRSQPTTWIGGGEWKGEWTSSRSAARSGRA